MARFCLTLFFLAEANLQGLRTASQCQAQDCGLSLLQASYGVQSAGSHSQSFEQVALQSTLTDVNALSVPAAGMLSWYQHENIAATSWPSSVGGFATRAGGSPSVSSDAPHYLYGTKQSWVNWGLIVNSDNFTICTVFKFASPAWTSPVEGRVITSDAVPGCNWHTANKGHLNGLVFGGEGAGGYQTPVANNSARPWTVMCTSNTGVVYIDDCTSIGNGHHSCTGQQVGAIVTNDPTTYWGSNEPSDWAIMEIMTWNRVLSISEINSAMGYLNNVVQQSTSNNCTISATTVPCKGSNTGFSLDILHVRASRR